MSAMMQGVVTYAPPVEAFATGIKIGSNDQRDISDRSSDHSHFHERSRIKKRTRMDPRSASAYREVLVNTRAAFHGANGTCTVATR